MIKESDYYNISDDIEAYPDAWIYLITGGRGTGKTYSSLVHCLKTKSKFVFLKRTLDDVNLLCAGHSKLGQKQADYGVDFSPFKSINRDFGTRIEAYGIRDGIGGFWECGEEGEPKGMPIGYIFALSGVTKFKGFDLSDCDYLIFDEFIPNIYDRVNRNEGEQLLDLYMTVSRDREQRGKPPLKIICLANATSISNPTFNILEVTDTVVKMEGTGKEVFYDPDRFIFLRRLPDDSNLVKAQKQTAIYKAMGDTEWGSMSFDNKFAYNDFSNVQHVKLKNYRPLCSVKYKKETWYIYEKEYKYYICRSQHNGDLEYDLNLENDQKLFYYDQVIDLKNACIEGDLKTETYTMYDLIINYKKFFKNI